jgi:hypothetical protein
LFEVQFQTQQIHANAAAKVKRINPLQRKIAED